MPEGGRKRKRDSTQLPDFFSKREVEAIMGRPNLTVPTGIRNRTMLELMYRGGLRVGEVTKLLPRDVQPREGLVNIRSEISKGDKDRIVELPQQPLDFIRQWKVLRRAYAGECPLLFVTLRGTGVSPSYLRHLMLRYKRRIGISGPCHPHMLRHTFATELLNEGFNIREVQELLGHRNVKTTEVYTHISRPDLARRLRQRG